MADIQTTSSIVQTSGGNAVSRVSGSVVNNAILDPIQGFDADVWVIDQATGQYNLVGRFTSVQITIRNATEPYLELNQRIPRYLDGEIQIGWVLERGMVDTRILQQTFGYSALSRELRLSRNPRMQITFEINAPELDKVKTIANSSRKSIGNGELFISTDAGNGFANRKAIGQIQMNFCKVDSFTMGVTAGRNVIANRWEGLCESIEEINRSSVWSGLTLTETADAGTSLAARGASSQTLSGNNAGRPSGIAAALDSNQSAG